MRSPLEIIAHRGFSQIAPENTIAAFKAALEHNADGVEFDVQLSADGIPVVIHDPTLNRTTNGRGKVASKTLAELKALEAGNWFTPLFAGEKIPTFQEVLDLFKDSEVKLYAEVKQAHLWQENHIEQFVTTIVSQGWQHRCIVASFDADFLNKIDDSHLTVGYHVSKSSEYAKKLNYAVARNSAILLCEYSLLLKHSDLIAIARQQSVDIVAWTVDKKEDLERLTQRNITRIITNALL